MLKKIFIALGVLIGLVAILAFTIAILYEDQVKKIVIGESNKK